MAKIHVDGHKLRYHPQRVKDWKITGDCAPIYVEIGPTNRCNHKCMFCALDWLEHGGADINSEVMYKTLDDMASYGVKSLMFAGEGEPFLHKETPEFIKFAKQKGIDVAVTSNGAAYNKEKAEKTLPYLSWIRFSVDAGTPQTYAQLHGTREEDFEKVLENIKYAAEIKRKNNYPVIIGVQALLTNKSIGELESLTSKIKAIGADNMQIKPYSHHPSSKNDLSFDFSEAEKIRSKLENLETEQFQVAYRTNTIKRLNDERPYSDCHGLPFFSLIDSKGNVIPCNLYYNNSEFYYGNVNEKLFSEIWQSERRKQVLDKICKNGIEQCRRGCRLDAINRYLDSVKKENVEIDMQIEQKPIHANFI